MRTWGRELRSDRDKLDGWRVVVGEGLEMASGCVDFVTATWRQALQRAM
jgi:hypothetical protein